MLCILLHDFEIWMSFLAQKIQLFKITKIATSSNGDTRGKNLEERGSLQEQLRETLEKLQNAEVRTRRTLETPWGDVNVKLSSEQLTLLVACCLYKV